VSARNLQLSGSNSWSWPKNARGALASVVLMTMYNRAGMSPARHHLFAVSMPTLDERVAYIEGRLEEQSQRFDARLDRLDAKIDAVGQRLDSKLDGIAQRLDSRIDVLDATASRHFTWLVGIQVAVLIAIVTASLR
jgi:hypothetical protein